MGLSMALGRGGAYSVDMSPTWFAGAYAGGWQPPLEIAALFAGARSSPAESTRGSITGAAHARSRPKPRPLFVPRHRPLRAAYWYLLVLCVLWYSVIFAFRSTFSIKYFQHAHGLDLAAAGAINSYVFLAALFATPAFGWLCDRVGRYAPFLAFGALLLPIAIAVMALPQGSLGLGTVLIGISYSLVPAVMWPLTAKLVPENKLGTALGLMWVVQNAGIGGANLIAGWLNDAYGAGAAEPGRLPADDVVLLPVERRGILLRARALETGRQAAATKRPTPVRLRFPPRSAEQRLSRLPGGRRARGPRPRVRTPNRSRAWRTQPTRSIMNPMSGASRAGIVPPKFSMPHALAVCSPEA